MNAYQIDRRDRQRADLDRRLPLERRARLTLVMAEDRRNRERRAALAERIDSARFNAALSRWHAARAAVESGK